MNTTTTTSARQARAEFDARYGWYEALYISNDDPAEGLRTAEELIEAMDA